MTILTHEEVMVQRDQQALGMDDARAQMAMDDQAQRDAQGDEFVNQWAHGGAGPSAKDFDYGAALANGEPLEVSDDPFLPNSYIREGALIQFGRDTATGRQVLNDPSTALGGFPHFGGPDLDFVPYSEDDGLDWYTGDDIGVAAGRAAYRGLFDAIRGTGEAAQAYGTKMAEEGQLAATRSAGRLMDYVVGKLADLPEPEALQETSGIIEDMSASVVQFALGFVGGGRGHMSMADDILRGAVAGQTFDPAEGNLSTVLDEAGMLPDLLKFLNSKHTTEEYGEFAGRLSLALEEAGLGALAPFIGRALLKAKARYGQQMKGLLDQGHELLRESGSTVYQGNVLNQLGAEGVDIEQVVWMYTAGIPTDEIVAKGLAALDASPKTKAAIAKGLDALTLIARGGRGLGQQEAEFVEQAVDAGMPAEVAQAAWQRAQAGEGPPGPVGEGIEPAPAGARIAGMPAETLVMGTGERPVIPVPKQWSTGETADKAVANMDAVHAAHPDPLADPASWADAQQSYLGGQYLPAPPHKAIEYRNDPRLYAEKLEQLDPALKEAVDQGFENVELVKQSLVGNPTEYERTVDLMSWGLLSRGLGPVQQEAAFIDIYETMQPFVEAAAKGLFDDEMLKNWDTQMSAAVPAGSPGRSAQHNVNAIGRMFRSLGTTLDDGTVPFQRLHEILADESLTGRDFRREFNQLVARSGKKAGLDNKVVSFIALVAGKIDVLVMDRIQTGHLFDAERYGKANIYDGFIRESGDPRGKKGGKTQEGFRSVMGGPQGTMTTELLEDGLRESVEEAYGLAGRAEDGNMARFHWESWVINSSQAVEHSTLRTVAERGAGEQIGSVVEGKRGTFSSGGRYIRESGKPPRFEYPLSDGGTVEMSPEAFGQFQQYIKNPKHGIIPRGFKVTEATDAPWYELPGVDRTKLDATARQFAEGGPPQGAGSPEPAAAAAGT